MMECGEQCAVVTGTQLIHKLYADSLDIPIEVNYLSGYVAVTGRK